MSPGDGRDQEWPEPQPIQAPLQPVLALAPETMLPKALRGWVMEEANRMPCPPDFIAAAALVGLGAIIGARCAIKPKAKDDWLVVPNLWGGIVALPSAKKSPAIDVRWRWKRTRRTHGSFRGRQGGLRGEGGPQLAEECIADLPSEEI